MFIASLHYFDESEKKCNERRIMWRSEQNEALSFTLVSLTIFIPKIASEFLVIWKKSFYCKSERDSQ